MKMPRPKPVQHAEIRVKIPRRVKEAKPLYNDEVAAVEKFLEEELPKQKTSERRQNRAERARKHRANLPAEKIATIREKDASLKRSKRAKETDAEKLVRRSVKAKNKRKRRSCETNLFEDDRNNLRKNGLSHFMDLEERRDLLNQDVDDPLGVNCPDPFEELQWVPLTGQVVKTEVPQGVELGKITLTEIPLCPDNVTLIELPVKLELPTTKAEILDDNFPDIVSPWRDESDSLSEINYSEEYKEKPKIRKKNRLHDCNICNKCLSSKRSLRVHKLKKHKIQTSFNCELCGLTFDLQKKLVQHHNEVHLKKDVSVTIKCDSCCNVNSDYLNFVTSVQTHYSDVDSADCVEQAICEHCGKVYKRTEGLRIHHAMVHNTDGGAMRDKLKQQEKNFICDACGKRFAFNCLLRDHINLHTGHKPYLCQMCGRFFAQKSSLKQHVRTHNTVRPFKCADCNQGFYGRGDLKKHMRKHTGERPYVCEVCGEGFSQSSHLGVHRRSHTGERPFQCDVCERGFAKRGDVVRHRRIHTGELPYLCQVCGKAFRQSTQCANHIKNHHPAAQVPVSRNPAPVSVILPDQHSTWRNLHPTHSQLPIPYGV